MNKNMPDMSINWQPHLAGTLIKLRPLLDSDFDSLYQVASDPLIWEQHPEKFRYKKEGFIKYFESGIQSRGALLVIDKSSGEILGSSRFYDHDIDKSQIVIGYTFLARKCWGKSYNKELKTLMINYAFNYATSIQFIIGINNTRSRMAIGKTGAIFSYQDNATAFYTITKENWYEKS